jgi:hypothetical protein
VSTETTTEASGRKGGERNQIIPTKTGGGKIQCSNKDLIRNEKSG